MAEWNTPLRDVLAVSQVTNLGCARSTPRRAPSAHTNPTEDARVTLRTNQTTALRSATPVVATSEHIDLTRDEIVIPAYGDSRPHTDEHTARKYEIVCIYYISRKLIIILITNYYYYYFLYYIIYYLFISIVLFYWL